MKFISSLLFILCSTVIFSQTMDNQRLEKLLSETSDSVVGMEGRWQIKYKELTLLVITDETNDRMRIITPIAETANMDKDLLLDCLAANFHTALDVKYAISNDVMWSVYVHPLSPLSKEELTSAISQVYYAAMTFGSTFTSTELLFGGGKKIEEKPKPTVKKT